jgi:hypothetical protein
MDDPDPTRRLTNRIDAHDQLCHAFLGLADTVGGAAGRHCRDIAVQHRRLAESYRAELTAGHPGPRDAAPPGRPIDPDTPHWRLAYTAHHPDGTHYRRYAPAPGHADHDEEDCPDDHVVGTAGEEAPELHLDLARLFLQAVEGDQPGRVRDRYGRGLADPNFGSAAPPPRSPGEQAG